MNRIFLMSGLAAALAFTTAAMAAGGGSGDHVEDLDVAPDAGASPVRLVSWDGDFELLTTSRRLRIWRSHVAYRMTVDSEGNVTNCELTESFRRAYITQRLCAILSEHHTFEPALDDSGMPVEGTYTAQISYQEIRDRM
ncbi:hypothetical protein [uncultured Erythrobacter sp.]|uniref:hypothetical protein n=1 Tax=uncultured Erythrobacter sp. TaxID=263913 RepID=UPI002602F112|nr:hypothetical protein [uncultured Erythrobacter sp.]